jgi:hypothetical protein
MKKNMRLKSLVLISFVIFSLPFFQTCSDRSLKRSPRYRGEFTGYVQDSLNFKMVYNEETKIKDTVWEVIKVSETEKQTIIAKEKIDKEVWLKKAKKENTVNAYYLGIGTFKEIEFSKSDLIDKTFYALLSFTLIIVFTFAMILLSFREKFKLITILSSINLLLIIIAPILLYSGKVIEDINQIKYGYYLFIINSILIIIESKNKLKKLTIITRTQSGAKHPAKSPC